MCNLHSLSFRFKFSIIINHTYFPTSYTFWISDSALPLKSKTFFFRLFWRIYKSLSKPHDSPRSHFQNEFLPYGDESDYSECKWQIDWSDAEAASAPLSGGTHSGKTSRLLCNTQSCTCHKGKHGHTRTHTWNEHRPKEHWFIYHHKTDLCLLICPLFFFIGGGDGIIGASLSATAATRSRIHPHHIKSHIDR